MKQPPYPLSDLTILGTYTGNRHIRIYALTPGEGLYVYWMRQEEWQVSLYPLPIFFQFAQRWQDDGRWKATSAYWAMKAAHVAPRGHDQDAKQLELTF